MFHKIKFYNVFVRMNCLILKKELDFKKRLIDTLYLQHFARERAESNQDLLSR